jgi:hypothetical protein
MEHGEAPPGFRLAPAIDPVLVLRVLDLDVPAFVEPLFQQDALAQHLIGFIWSRLGVPLGAGETNGGDDEQECKDKAHGISIDQLMMQHHSLI